MGYGQFKEEKSTRVSSDVRNVSGHSGFPFLAPSESPGSGASSSVSSNRYHMFLFFAIPGERNFCRRIAQRRWPIHPFGVAPARP